MKLRVVASLWEQYRLLIPATAPALQIDETRKAFYAGAHGLLCAIARSLDETDEVTDSDVSLLEGIHRELLAFAASVADPEPRGPQA